MKALSIVAVVLLCVDTTLALDANDPALVGVWLFDENTGNTIADVKNGNTGTARPAASFAWEPGKFGSALVASGGGGITVRNSDSIATIVDAVTVAGWFRVDADSDTGIRKDGSFLLEDQSASEPVANGFSFRVWTDQGISPGFYGKTELEQGQWYHVAGTYDGAIMELYINGVPESEQGALSSVGADWPPEWSGQISTGSTLQLKFGTESYTGGLDEIVILNRAATRDEIVQLMGGWASLSGQPGDLDGDGDCDAADIDALAAAIQAGQGGKDLDGDGSVTEADRRYLIQVLKNTWIGDANLDGEFNSTDLVGVFQIGEYEDTANLNSGWADGDWNGDMEFNSSDFVLAFQAAGYEAGPRPQGAPVPEPASTVVVGLLSLMAWVANRRAIR
jgi:hypothetical protein